MQHGDDGRALVIRGVFGHEHVDFFIVLLRELERGKLVVVGCVVVDEGGVGKARPCRRTNEESSRPGDLAKHSRATISSQAHDASA